MILMRIVNTVCINNEKNNSQYVDLIVKVFDKHPEMSFPEGMECGIQCQLRTSKEVC